MTAGDWFWGSLETIILVCTIRQVVKAEFRYSWKEHAFWAVWFGTSVAVAICMNRVDVHAYLMAMISALNGWLAYQGKPPSKWVERVIGRVKDMGHKLKVEAA